MILIDVSGTSAVIRKQAELTTGLIGATAQFRFDDTWDDLKRIAVFRAGTMVRDAIDVAEKTVIPWEVLSTAGVPLEIGVYGKNGDGSVVIPTIWTKTRNIKLGTDPSGDESLVPPVPVWEEMLNLVQEANDLAQSLREDANSGAFVGPQGEKGDTGDTGPQGPKGDTGATGPQGPSGADGAKGEKGDTGDIGPAGETGPIGPQGPKGDKGEKGDTGATGPKGPQGEKGDTGGTGPQGPNGKSAYQYAQDGGYTGTEQEFAKKLALEPLIGTTAEITPQQVVSAMVTGTPFTIVHFDETFGEMKFNSFAFSGTAMNALIASVVFVTGGTKFCAQLTGDLSTNTWAFTAFQLAGPDDIPEVPTALKNPHALTINGTDYDGSQAVDMTDKINELIDNKLSAIANAEEVAF